MKCPKCKKSDRLFGGTDGHSCERCEITYADGHGYEILGWKSFLFWKKPILGQQKYNDICSEMNCESVEPYFKSFI